MNFTDIIQYIQPTPDHFNFVEKSGQTFGQIHILFYAGKSIKGKVQFAGRCGCGEYLLLNTGNLAPTNKANSCGCLRKSHIQKENVLSRIAEVESKTEYKVIKNGHGGYDSQWTFLCPTHGEFTTKWGHVARRGTRCPSCMYSSGGFNQIKSGSFYVNEVLDSNQNIVALKFGITNFEVNKRLKEIETKSVYNLKNLFAVTFEKGTDALLLERAFSKEFGKKFLTSKEMERGFTETISPTSKQLCLTWLSEYLKDNK